jgi:bifunctional oligoribonuclease and PAP phosphatase NrnA
MANIPLNKFRREFNSLQYVINKSSRILLFAHTRPDGDTTGSVCALKEHLIKLGKSVDIACFDPFPEFLKKIIPYSFEFPDHLDLGSYETVIACDSVERGFEKIFPRLREDQLTAIIDHHPDINLSADINIVDSSYSSVCEIIYDFFIFSSTPITKEIATYLLVGIIGDTGNFQHANTTTRIMEIASDLMKKGASLSKITNSVFSNKKISTLKLWGKAFEKARINPKNKMIMTVLTLQDLADCNATVEDVGQVATILNTVPGTSFSLVIQETDSGILKGSLRSEEYKGVDVSLIAHQMGGGGHKLASGFEIKGKILETEEGWKII